MSDIFIRKTGRCGRITLNRPAALNALTLPMIEAIGAALAEWKDDADVAMLVIDAEGEKAFCAGGDIADIYDALKSGRPEEAREFWRREYPVNLALFDFPKPVASFLQGFTMGGGVGVGCHASHRIVCENSRIAMPECSIGLVPDVGGSLLLARAPGRLGEYMGTTGYRMGPDDAIVAGFADYYVPVAQWPELIRQLESTGDWTHVDQMSMRAPTGELAEFRDEIDRTFAGETLRDILAALENDDSQFAQDTLKKINRNAPLAMACAVELIHRARSRDDMAAALVSEYRFAHRIAAHGDFQEGIRASVIDKDKSPNWAHKSPGEPTMVDVANMLMPLGEDEIDLERTS
ncbi:MAG: enoyl-CoA hydratase/isomerase family protein [Boseongicola sp.]|nr:enoyl-CoA hydratase/isomerase family protein [Boseongicola sp.]